MRGAGTLLGMVLGPGLVALAQAPAIPPEADDWLKVGGAIVTITASVLTARHLAEQAKAVAVAADQRASAVGSKVDDLRTAFHNERDRVTELRTEQKRDHDEVEKLRASRHDYIDKELAPRLGRFENHVEEELERFGARLAEVEARSRSARHE